MRMKEIMAAVFCGFQACLGTKCLESLIDSAVQLMRKCHPKCPVPLTSDQSVYSFPLPGKPISCVPTDPEPPGIVKHVYPSIDLTIFPVNVGREEASACHPISNHQPMLVFSQAVRAFNLHC